MMQDPWLPIRGFIDALNERRKNIVTALTLRSGKQQNRNEDLMMFVPQPLTSMELLNKSWQLLGRIRK